MCESFRALRSVLRARYRLGFTALLQRNQAPKYPDSRRRSSDTNSGASRPLEGVRVLDLTRVLAGPFATMILGDLGAEVIKVERPGGGDDTRTWGPPFVASESVYFLSVNRNKKSIAVDLKHRRGAEVIRQLAGVCDVLVENFLPGNLPQLGLGYAELSRINPGLVYCSVSGYGQTGPQARSPGYDSIASAVSGMMHITGPEDGEPVRPGVAMTDLATGLYAHGAVMAALLHRQKTGRGSHIDCNLLSAQSGERGKQEVRRAKRSRKSGERSRKSGGRSRKSGGRSRKSGPMSSIRSRLLQFLPLMSPDCSWFSP